MSKTALFSILSLNIAACAATATDNSAPIVAIVPEGFESVVSQFHYSPAVRAGDFIYLAGVVAGLPQDEQGNLVPASDENLERSFDNAFQAIAYVLAAAGASWNDVVDMTSYHTDLPGQIGVMARVKDRYVTEPFPAWTAIDIDRLFPDNGIAEIKVVVYAPQ
ncbi:MAG: RidA family protein [Marinicaulis sp.]|nr:RidA family protein [Marinicaulis sp.]